MHLHSNKLSAIATISSSLLLQLFTACFFCQNNFNLSQGLLGSDDKIIVEFPEAIIAGELSNPIGDLSLLYSRPFCLILNFKFFPNS